MLYSSSAKRKNHVLFHNLKSSSSALCLGLVAIFMLAVFSSGCVVHPGRGHLMGHGHGHHKAKVKIVPEVSVSPLIVIGH